MGVILGERDVGCLCCMFVREVDNRLHSKRASTLHVVVCCASPGGGPPGVVGLPVTPAFAGACLHLSRELPFCSCQRALVTPLQ